MTEDQTAPDLADKIAAKLLDEYRIGTFSRFMDDQPDFDEVYADELAEVVRKVMEEPKPSTTATRPPSPLRAP